LLNVPEWTATFKVDYAKDLGDQILGFARADYDLTGRSHGAFSPTDPDYLRPSYGVLNATVGIRQGPLEFSFFAKNLLDNSQIIQRPSLLFFPEAYTLRPLTAGVLVKVKF